MSVTGPDWQAPRGSPWTCCPPVNTEFDDPLPPPLDSVAEVAALSPTECDPLGVHQTNFETNSADRPSPPTSSPFRDHLGCQATASDINISKTHFSNFLTINYPPGAELCNSTRDTMTISHPNFPQNISVQAVEREPKKTDERRMRGHFWNTALCGSDKNKFANAEIIEQGESKECAFSVGEKHMWLKGKAHVKKVVLGRQEPRGEDATCEVKINMALFRVPGLRVDLLLILNDPPYCHRRVPLKGEFEVWKAHDWDLMVESLVLKSSDMQTLKETWYTAVHGYCNRRW